MNSSALSTFLTIVETRNLSRAAHRLNVTQSTVTARLNALESELGQTLFLRRKSGAELTSAGFKFQRYAELMTQLWRQARQETSLPSEIEAVCNIGCHFDLWPGLGRTLLEVIRQERPDVAMSIWSGEQTDIDRWLGSGLVDAALCYSPTLRENRTAYSLPEDRLILVSTEPRERVPWDPKYVFVDSGEEFRRSHAATYPGGDTPSIIFGCAVWALDHILAWGGSAYLPDRLANPYVASANLHLVTGVPEFRRAVYLVVDKRVLTQWSWLDEIVTRISAPCQSGA